MGSAKLLSAFDASFSLFSSTEMSCDDLIVLESLTLFLLALSLRISDINFSKRRPCPHSCSCRRFPVIRICYRTLSYLRLVDISSSPRVILHLSPPDPFLITFFPSADSLFKYLLVLGHVLSCWLTPLF